MTLSLSLFVPLDGFNGTTYYEGFKRPPKDSTVTTPDGLVYIMGDKKGVLKDTSKPVPAPEANN